MPKERKVRLLSCDAVARLLDCEERQVRRLVRKGLLAPPLACEGLGPRFRETDVAAYLGYNEVTAGDEQLTEHTITIPGGVWMCREEALDYLGLPDEELDRLLEAKLIRTCGEGSEERFYFQTVYAVGVLWDRLDALLQKG
jgi:hypothetical protein